MNRRKFLTTSLLSGLAVQNTAASAKEGPDGRLQILLVTGGHDYDNSFHTVFEQPDAPWRVVVNPHPGAFSGDIRKRYDVLVLYDMPRTMEEQRRVRLREFFEAGKGVVALHHAIVSHQDWPWYEEAIGGKYLSQPEGASAASTFLHDVDLRIRIVERHPVTEGLEDFEINDETYKGMRISPQNQVLLRTDEPTSDGPVAWVSSYSKSRVVYIQLGHGERAHRNPHYQRLVRNAILWAGQRK